MSEENNVPGERIISTCLVLITLLALGAALSYTKPIMIPFLLSLLMVYLVSPVADALHLRLKLPYGLSVFITLGLAIGFLSLVVLFVVLNFQNFLAGAQTYRTSLEKLPMKIVEISQSLGFDFDRAAIFQMARNLPFVELLRGTAEGLIALVTNTLLVFIFVLFIMMGRPKTSPQPKSATRGRIGKKINSQVRKYLVTKLISSLVTAILVGGTLGLIGVDLAVLFGVVTFFLNLIPTLGSLVATLLPLPIALMQFESPASAILALCVPGAIQIIVGNVVEPRFLGDSLGLHPVTILISLMFWGLIWGGVGMVLAVPITAVLKIVFNELKETRFLSQLMEGQF